MRRIFVAAVALSTVLVVGMPQGASAGDITMHPSGFGEHSYAAWKAHQGLADSAGTKEQALYLQKMTSTATFAAGVVVFEGVAGMSTADLGELAFWYRADGHCGAGAPRFNLRVENPPGSGIRNTFFFGCNSGMVPGGTATNEHGTFFERRTVGSLPPGEVVSLAIVFDEGTEFPPGYVFLDDIRVAGHTWSSATDNGRGGTTTANTPVTAAEAEAILGEPLAVALGS